MPMKGLYLTVIQMEIILSDEERQKYFGTDSKWKNGGHFFDFSSEEGKSIFEERIVKAIEKNKAERKTDGGIDFLLVTFGYWPLPSCTKDGIHSH